MTALSDTVEADQALKAKHRAMWALGDYPSVAAEIIPDLGAVLVEACGIGPGVRVLDVAAGSGNAAIPAALAGAAVVACDLTPELFDSGREHAALHGAEVEWYEADAEALPFADGEFDVVLSCVGAMFAPHHQTAADEMARVCRPGGTIGLVNWTPEGFVGQMLATMKPYAPPSPPGAQPPPLWGNEDHVKGLFGARSPTWAFGAGPSRLTTSPTLGHFVTTSRAATVQPSVRTEALLKILTGSPRSTATSPS